MVRSVHINTTNNVTGNAIMHKESATLGHSYLYASTHVLTWKKFITSTNADFYKEPGIRLVNKMSVR